MVFFVKPTPPTGVTRVYDRVVMYGTAATIVMLAVAQLFTFEDLGQVFASTYGMPGGAALIFAALIVSFEVAAIPFLLGMAQSPLARVCSMVAGWIVTLAWIVLTIWSLIRSADMNTGLLGATIDIPASGVAVLFGILLLLLVVRSSWVAWPFKNGRR